MLSVAPGNFTVMERKYGAYSLPMGVNQQMKIWCRLRFGGLWRPGQREQSSVTGLSTHLLKTCSSWSSFWLWIPNQK